MKHQVSLLLAAGAGVIGGKYLFEPRSTDPHKDHRTPQLSTATKMSSPPVTATHHHRHNELASASPREEQSDPSQLTPSAIANTRTLACLPSTEISKSAHPDDAAKIMDEPLPSSPLIAKKIPSKEDSGEMQAEPYTKSEGGVGLFDRVKFW